ncbi:hypothetical protein [Herpetosiphon gulosus]|uniref:DUF7948 domain-containing protein n=1 Tax=Herpetosiphon gulosus TaxID=1973496 RepID=A0ABP9X5P0_9CHLR
MRDRSRWSQPLRRFLLCGIVISNLSWLAVPTGSIPDVAAAPFPNEAVASSALATTSAETPSPTVVLNSTGFVPNHGQLANDIVYETALAGGILQVLPSGWQLRLSSPLTSSLEPITLTMELVGASSPAAWESSLPLVTTVSDYRSPDSSRWRSDVPQYQQIQARTIYPQIDLHYTVTPSATLKSSYLVAAGADPNQIGWRYPDADSVQISNDGSLVIQINATTIITESAPIAW